MLQDNRPIIDQINLRLGYRLQLREAAWPARVTIGKPFTVDWKWANAGVAPCYPGGFVALTLKDSKGGLVAVLSDEAFNLRRLPPGLKGAAPVQSHQSTFAAGLIAPATRPAECEVFVSVGQRDGTPTLALPLPNDDGQHRYRLGKIIMEK